MCTFQRANTGIYQGVLTNNTLLCWSGVSFRDALTITFQGMLWRRLRGMQHSCGPETEICSARRDRQLPYLVCQDRSQNRLISGCYSAHWLAMGLSVAGAGNDIAILCKLLEQLCSGLGSDLGQCTVPVSSLGPYTFISVSAAPYATCGILANSSVLCCSSMLCWNAIPPLCL